MIGEILDWIDLESKRRTLRLSQICSKLECRPQDIYGELKSLGYLLEGDGSLGELIVVNQEPYFDLTDKSDYLAWLDYRFTSL